MKIRVHKSTQSTCRKDADIIDSQHETCVDMWVYITMYYTNIRSSLVFCCFGLRHPGDMDTTWTHGLDMSCTEHRTHTHGHICGTEHILRHTWQIQAEHNLNFGCSSMNTLSIHTIRRPVLDNNGKGWRLITGGWTRRKTQLETCDGLLVAEQLWYIR